MLTLHHHQKLAYVQFSSAFQHHSFIDSLLIYTSVTEVKIKPQFQ